MIRVGFIISATDSNWMGGLNYINNLLHAIKKIPNRKIEPVLIVPPSLSSAVLSIFPDWPILVTSFVEVHKLIWRVSRKLPERLYGRNILIEYLLKKNNIKILSHSGQLGGRAIIPTIGWIADFQHRRMPEFFQPSEIALREKNYHYITDRCSTVILSSFDAQSDLKKFAPYAIPCSKVLQFVSGFAVRNNSDEVKAVLIDKYKIKAPFFHLPNQFWMHKNHRVVIDALIILKKMNHQVQVLCTGHTEDYRNPKYFDELMNCVDNENLSSNFRVLGLVPYEDMKGLMEMAVAVINPSKFEGWSTTVEESKSLGLKIILSDIPVHHEQNPERGIFFNPNDADALAFELLNSLGNYSHASESVFRKKALEDINKRFIDFGVNYQNIVLDTLERGC